MSYLLNEPLGNPRVWVIFLMHSSEIPVDEFNVVPPRKFPRNKFTFTSTPLESCLATLISLDIIKIRPLVAVWLLFLTIWCCCTQITHSILPSLLFGMEQASYCLYLLTVVWSTMSQKIVETPSTRMQIFFNLLLFLSRFKNLPINT